MGMMVWRRLATISAAACFLMTRSEYHTLKVSPFENDNFVSSRPYLFSQCPLLIKIIKRIGVFIWLRYLYIVRAYWRKEKGSLTEIWSTYFKTRVIFLGKKLWHIRLSKYVHIYHRRIIKTFRPSLQYSVLNVWKIRSSYGKLIIQIWFGRNGRTHQVEFLATLAWSGGRFHAALLCPLWGVGNLHWLTDGTWNVVAL